VTVIKDGASLSVRLSADGSAAKVAIVVWRRSPETTLLLHRADVVSAEVRAQLVKRLPDDVQTEGAEVLEAAALELALRRAEGGDRNKEERPADPEPWLDEVNGAGLLADFSALFSRYLVLPDGGADVLAAFILLTYVVEAFDSVPYLAILSPTPRCGKSRLLELIEMLAWRPWLTTSATGAVIYRRIERLHPTLLLDEAEVVRSHGDAAGIIRSLLQAGYRRGVQVTRCVGEHFEDRDFDIYGPKVFAAIGRLPSALLDRCIVLEMRRKRRDEEVARFRKRDAASDALTLRRRARRWEIDHVKALEGCRPPLPEPLDDRAQEIWEPLLAVGTRAGEGWLERLTEAATRFSAGREDESATLELLADIREILTERVVERIPSADLVQSLVEVEGRRWAEWSHGRPLTPTGLARLLKDFGIRPIPLWIDSKTQRCYTAAMFADAFARYLQPLKRKDASGEEAELTPEEPQGAGATAGPTSRDKPGADGTPYALTVQNLGDEAAGHGAGEARLCTVCGEPLQHHGSNPNAGWICPRCYPDADRALRGQP